ncbi:multifunctional CCA addition/repair protein [Vandammella animalimorsus]|uniref:Multifunctional CCA addition/repair protein n=1 Tax=Vandammella animalimorsus TaxID=2029117 RepID=A0A2A2T7F1_9BURK|nr:multifunctional CCA addition/repair protein [Vandammella animalimorsus]PAT32797.1 multifunctional CCA addition/repair protein [Vandammella animalimorsus]PAX17826.1 multifunctional CCA addition/repair protein [Vandammella animalimorsus]PAX19980.1 multifunctional CCA addition/repair protein [Vandammella animalimorsus]
MTHRQSQAASDAPTPRIYMVGGAVRDQLLGRPVQDRDWVVVGATPQWMSAQGFTPVGKDFPVFLHPQTHEEYALARTERKSGRGYKGFTVYADPSVTLEQDLARRDLTINAIAMRQLADGRQEWVDPYGGRADLQRKRLRHVSAAFAEDPLRILRLARFAARFADFSIAEDTMALMRGMVQAGEAAHLVPERVWQELARGLMEHAPLRMFTVLHDCGALAVVLPELAQRWGQPPPAHSPIPPALQALAAAVRAQAPLAVRYACLLYGPAPHGTPGAAEAQAMATRLKVPTELRELALLLARQRQAIDASLYADAAHTIALLERCDALRRPERFALALWACECMAQADAALPQPSQSAAADAIAPAYPQRPRLLAALQAAQSVDTAPIAAQAARQGLQGPQIGAHIQAARIAAVAALF